MRKNSNTSRLEKFDTHSILNVSGTGENIKQPTS